MKQLALLTVFLFGAAAPASADIWRWVDAKGDVHFVDSDKLIYTWVDEVGEVYFSDTPDHEDAVAVVLVWHSSADSVEEAEAEAARNEIGDDVALPGETEAERHEREQAEAYYCKRAQQIYDSYVNAPRLYRTDDSGERVYLSDEEAETTLAETKARVDELCSQ